MKTAVTLIVLALAVAAPAKAACPDTHYPCGANSCCPK